MAFRELNDRQKLSGFYARIKNNTMQGIVTKFIDKKDGPFFIVKLTGACKVNQQTDEGKKYKLVTAKAGEWIGIGATTTLLQLKEYAGKEVRVIWTGETPSRHFKGKMVQLFRIAIDDGNPDESDVPF